MPRPFQSPEKRAFGRRETCVHAMAKMHGRPPEPCIVRNFSDGGALLEFGIELDPPFKFRLIVEAKDLDTECEVRHRKGKAIGVRFIAAGAEAGALLRSMAPPPGEAGPSPAFQPEATGTITKISGQDLRRKMFGSNA